MTDFFQCLFSKPFSIHVLSYNKLKQMAMEVHYSQKASNPPSLKKYNETKQYLKLENDCQNTHIQHLTAVCVFCEMLLFFFYLKRIYKVQKVRGAQ